MTLDIYTVTVDCMDPQRLAAFWAAALGYVQAYDEGSEVCIEPPSGDYSALLFIEVPDRKIQKNRIHLDLNCDNQDEEVDRLIALGARRVDVGQGEVDWVVMADPEGNEFCVLRPRPDDE
jgi:hypothetical protein